MLLQGPRLQPRTLLHSSVHTVCACSLYQEEALTCRELLTAAVSLNSSGVLKAAVRCVAALSSSRTSSRNRLSTS